MQRNLMNDRRREDQPSLALARRKSRTQSYLHSLQSKGNTPSPPKKLATKQVYQRSHRSARIGLKATGVVQVSFSD